MEPSVIQSLDGRANKLRALFAFEATSKSAFALVVLVVAQLPLTRRCSSLMFAVFEALMGYELGSTLPAMAGSFVSAAFNPGDAPNWVPFLLQED
jgi:hypothetical protein